VKRHLREQAHAAHPPESEPTAGQSESSTELKQENENHAK